MEGITGPSFSWISCYDCSLDCPVESGLSSPSIETDYDVMPVLDPNTDVSLGNRSYSETGVYHEQRHDMTVYCFASMNLTRKTESETSRCF
jgi:hypothetical protein